MVSGIRSVESTPGSSGNINPTQNQTQKEGSNGGTSNTGFKKKPTTNNNANNEAPSPIPSEHKKIVEGVKLAMELVTSKMNNCMGFSNLILNETIKNLNEQHDKCKHSEVKLILASESRELKKEQDNLSKKMFSYELKGIEDWKKYLRGKFFEEESTINLWFRMVCYLDNRSSNSGSMTTKQMAESIKSSLY